MKQSGTTVDTSQKSPDAIKAPPTPVSINGDQTPSKSPAVPSTPAEKLDSSRKSISPLSDVLTKPASRKRALESGNGPGKDGKANDGPPPKKPSTGIVVGVPQTATPIRPLIPNQSATLKTLAAFAPIPKAESPVNITTTAFPNSLLPKIKFLIPAGAGVTKSASTTSQSATLSRIMDLHIPKLQLQALMAASGGSKGSQTQTRYGPC